MKTNSKNDKQVSYSDIITEGDNSGFLPAVDQNASDAIKTLKRKYTT